MAGTKLKVAEMGIVGTGEGHRNRGLLRLLYREFDGEKRIKDFMPFQINERAMAKARKDAVFMHCLPGYRGEDMTDEVIEGPQSAVWDQGENRMHTVKAVLVATTL